MSEEKQSNEAPKKQGNTEEKGSPGERLDQFISGAKQFSAIAGRRAKEMADVAAPKLKAFGDTATKKASRAFDSRATQGSLLRKAADFYNCGGKSRKQLMIIGGGVLLLLYIVLFIVVTVIVSNESGPNRSNFEKVQSGMTEQQVDSLLGMPSASSNVADGSLTKTWNSTYSDHGSIHVSFIDGRATTKLMDEASTASDSTPGAATPTVSSFSLAEYNKISIGMTKEQVEQLLGPPTLSIPETDKIWPSSTWGNPATDATILMINFRDGKAHSKSLINSNVERARQAIKDLGDQYASGDQALWGIAQQVRSHGWRASDDVMRDASPEMQSAYNAWRSASIAFPTIYETAPSITARP